eukprot:COSAG05_NODE_921_length_6590_cov_2.081985_3_plen_148_part_00
MPTEGLLCKQDEANQTDAFRRVYSRMNLHTAAGGLGVRKWETYCDAAYVGSWAQSWQVSQLKLGGTIVSVLPSLTKVIEEAHMLREATAHGWAHHLTAILPISRDLCTAWSTAVGRSKVALTEGCTTAITSHAPLVQGSAQYSEMAR